MRLLVASLLLCISFISCNPCKNKICLNGGSCVDGKCICINPYTGANCEVDACAGLNCHNGGNCYFGTCDCAPGYEGTLCDDLVTSKFVGGYNYSGTCTSPVPASTVSIAAYGSITDHEVILNTINGTNPIAVANGTNLTIQSQQLQSGEIVVGYGQKSGADTILLNLTFIPFGGDSNTCKFILVKF